MLDRVIRFLLLCEGTSDRALVPHLRQLLSYCGAAEVVGTAVALANIRDPGEGRASVLERKMRVVFSTESEFDVLFVHRDADSAGVEARAGEIAQAACNAELAIERVNVIPVRTTEAWILLDETEIRRVAGNPRGRQSLNLPRPSRVEQVGDPKSILEAALVAASNCQGHRLRKFRKKFQQHRRILLERLPVGGALAEVPAWARLRQEISDLVSRTASV
ncbi:MAG: DUF4276 family protein [Thiotrichales bacterium]|nr:DUF4276 family protein [Thiotrichales bacterium]